METFRTAQTQKSYDEYRLKCQSPSMCWLCEKVPLKTSKYWRIVENSFPYDRFVSIHHMLLPIRHVQEKDLNQDELKEFSEIKEKLLSDAYEFIMWATMKQQSVPQHYHVHLLVSDYKFSSFKSYHQP
jgi:hypothetical protein